MTLTPFEREGLGLLGYSDRESEFLFLVATHSGYFTNRQFKYFSASESGSVCHAFVRKLLERKHATFHAYRSGERVYHLFARKVYQAVGRENLRTRKKHELDYVKTRLVALDFVLEHPELAYLETEAEKLAFFEKEHRISKDILPAKMYRARRSAEVTPRYFVDRFPMFVNRACSPAIPTFTYVDAGAITLESFATHLRAYSELLRAIPVLEFIYISPITRLFRDAEVGFNRVVYSSSKQPGSINILNYFRVRSAWESKERVASSDVVLLKEAQAQYAGTMFDALYAQWRQGAVRNEEVIRSISSFRHDGRASFRTVVCGSSLKVFSDPKHKSLETCTEIGSDDAPVVVSA